MPVHNYAHQKSPVKKSLKGITKNPPTRDMYNRLACAISVVKISKTISEDN